MGSILTEEPIPLPKKGSVIYQDSAKAAREGSHIQAGFYFKLVPPQTLGPRPHPPVNCFQSAPYVDLLAWESGAVMYACPCRRFECLKRSSPIPRSTFPLQRFTSAAAWHQERSISNFFGSNRPAGSSSRWEAIDPASIGRPRRRLYPLTPSGPTRVSEAFASLSFGQGVPA